MPASFQQYKFNNGDESKERVAGSNTMMHLGQTMWQQKDVNIERNQISFDLREKSKPSKPEKLSNSKIEHPNIKRPLKYKVCQHL